MKHKILTLLITLLLGGFVQANPAPKLAGVTRFDSAMVGRGAGVSPNYQAFLDELKRGNAAAPLFEKLLVTGTPAAKLYAAVGLYQLDTARGKRALESLRSDSNEVCSLMGCIANVTTVGKTAEILLREDLVMAYLPREATVTP